MMQVPDHAGQAFYTILVGKVHDIWQGPRGDLPLPFRSGLVHCLLFSEIPRERWQGEPTFPSTP